MVICDYILKKKVLLFSLLKIYYNIFFCDGTVICPSVYTEQYTISADVYFVYLTDYVRICSLQYIRQKNPTICLQIRLFGMSHRDVPVTVSAQF